MRGQRPFKNNDGKLGERIWAHTIAKGWSIAELARQSGVSPQAIGDWLTGEVTNPHLKLVAKVATVLDVSLLYLLHGTDDPTDVLPQ